jgi:hypothetical protein
MQADEAVLIEKFTRLGVDDPQAAARSEIAEDIPQLAYARLERLVRTKLMRRRESMDVWWTNLQRERDRRPGSRPAAIAEVVGKCLAAGITLDELGMLAEDVASETAAGFAYTLGDPYDDELGDPSDLPFWALCEVGSEDDGANLTGRTMGALHEFLGPEE